MTFLAGLFQSALQGLMAFVLGVFGFSWDASAPENEDEVAVEAVAVVRLLLPQQTELASYTTKVAYREEATGCSKAKINIQMVDMPFVVEAPEAPEQPFIS